MPIIEHTIRNFLNLLSSNPHFSLLNDSRVILWSSYTPGTILIHTCLHLKWKFSSLLRSFFPIASNEMALNNSSSSSGIKNWSVFLSCMCIFDSFISLNINKIIVPRAYLTSSSSFFFFFDWYSSRMFNVRCLILQLLMLGKHEHMSPLVLLRSSILNKIMIFMSFWIMLTR